ncbi:hypothetical protein GCM10023260_03720 [Bartonella acomydis]|uniref:Uncharacterized protein n=1 Tax=Bartonella acomydis TaxID=686234 RepID=A0ABP9MEN0_9HYPH
MGKCLCAIFTEKIWSNEDFMFPLSLFYHKGAVNCSHNAITHDFRQFYFMDGADDWNKIF